MKGFAIVLLCVFAAVQGRSTNVRVSTQQRAVAALGEKPWVVHLRRAVATSGLLQTSAGALIDSNWVLTTADAVDDQRFIWCRLGAAEVIAPSLVVETSTVLLHSEWNPITRQNNIALINLNRAVETTLNIAPIGLPVANSGIGGSANYCAYGQAGPNNPGEYLSCWDVTLVAENNVAAIFEGEDISASRFDTGAPLVQDGRLVGLLEQPDEISPIRARFIRSSPYVNWVSGMTGVDVNPVAREGSLDVIIFDTGAPLVQDGRLVGLLEQPDEISPIRARFIRSSPYVNWVSGMTGVDVNPVAREGSLDVIIVN